MIVALFTLALLAQVGIGIDRAPAIPAATARPHVKHLVKHPATPSPVPTASASAMPSPEPSATFAHTAAPHAHSTQARSGNLCSHAADIAIDSATQEKVDTKSGTDNFVIHVSILNRGAASQGAHARQLISVYRNEERLVRMQIPALEQGEAYAFTTKFKRSADAGTNSTTLLFQLGGENYAPRSIEDCNDRNNSFRLTF